MRITIIFLSMLFVFQIFLGAETQKSVPALKTDTDITIDGKLDETIWQKAQPAARFLQYQPSKGSPASFKTETRILYDNKYIYFAITCYDPQPEKITASVSKREGELTTDDAVSIALDTFNDGQTAYIFFTNLKVSKKTGDWRTTAAPSTIPGTANGCLPVLKQQKAGPRKSPSPSKPSNTIPVKTGPGASVSLDLSHETSKQIPGAAQWNPICASPNSAQLQAWTWKR